MKLRAMIRKFDHHLHALVPTPPALSVHVEFGTGFSPPETGTPKEA
jgi:hypothetical protein